MRSMPLRPVVLGLFVSASLLVLGACGSVTVTHNAGSPAPGGSAPPPGTPPPPDGLPDPPGKPPVSTSITLNGVVTFDLVPFSTSPGEGLDYAATRQAPARGVTIEVLKASDGSVLATTQTDSLGAYSVAVPAQTGMKLRVKAEMVRTGAPGWSVRVKDNTAGNALYVIESEELSSGSTDPLQQNLHASSGWNAASNSYTEPRSAAPFAILDAIYDAQQLVLTADGAIEFPPLDIYWSPRNKQSVGGGAPPFADGDLGRTQYIRGASPAIYLLGEADVNTDEYDRDWILHEWTYYYLDAFSRNDSMGGPYETEMDLRAAYSHAWALAFPAMVSGESTWRDSFGPGQAKEELVDLEDNPSSTQGWFVPASLYSVLYDLVDSADDGADAVRLPFGSLHAALVDMRNTPALTSIYPFINALKAREPGLAGVIDTLLGSQGIVAAQPDDFAPGETNDNGSPRLLPLYVPIAVGGSQRTVHTSGSAQRYFNYLGNRRLLRLELATQRSITITATGVQAGVNPDIVVYREGQRIGSAESAMGSSETLTLSDLEAGTYVIEVFEHTNVYYVPGSSPDPLGFSSISVKVDP